jgi:2-dehydro-3-deoxyphosphogluconate aldolase/(4S)-4-hydroxy-2-oxoglutarate aldolase
MLLPSGGITARTARAFLDAGAFAVAAGTQAIPADLVTNGRNAEIETLLKRFVRAARQARPMTPSLSEDAVIRGLP